MKILCSPTSITFPSGGLFFKLTAFFSTWSSNPVIRRFSQNALSSRYRRNCFNSHATVLWVCSPAVIQSKWIRFSLRSSSSSPRLSSSKTRSSWFVSYSWLEGDIKHFVCRELKTGFMKLRKEETRLDILEPEKCPGKAIIFEIFRRLRQTQPIFESMFPISYA